MKKIWAALKGSVKFIQGLGTAVLGLLVVVVLIAMFTSGGPSAPVVADGTVLVVRPSGVLVERPERESPIEVFFRREFDQSPPPASSIHDLMIALERARTDDRIVAVQLDTSRLAGAGLANLHEIAAKLGELRGAGKPIYAVSGSYSQGDFLLAAEASTVYLNDFGSALMTGYGIYPTYYTGLLEKLGVTVNVFRVGTYKAAVEPYTLTAMSEAAKDANADFLGDLWSAYLRSVGNARGIAPEELQSVLDNFDTAFSRSGGDFADFALAAGWVDEKSTGRSWKDDIADAHGTDGSYREMGYLDYLAATEPKLNTAPSEIAVIVAEGTIAPGKRQPGIAGAGDIIADIRKARRNPATKAIILRVDSPGGSQYASELIRQELLEAQADDIPVIASMGPVAASGGYWISATADEIWAAPTTITGSIGIFALIPTFEGSAEKVGVAVDGVGTTRLSGGLSPLKGLSDPIASVIQSNINRGYEDFLSLVAGGRNMDIAEVDKIAQGRVWSGTRAKELGLVDHLGSFQQAVKAAANAAAVNDTFVLNFYEDQPSAFDAFIDGFLNAASDVIPQSHGVKASVASRIAAEVERMTQLLTQFRDPNHAYILCLACEVK